MENNASNSNSPQKAFVKTNDTASICCPHCNLIKNIAVGKFREGKHTFKIRCSCGKVFPVSLDFRKHYRKPTQLTGTYSVIEPPNNGGGLMKVNNISRGGIDFGVTGLHKIQVGQKILLTFQLDNKKLTEINIEGIVRSVRGGSIGCEFTESTQIGKDLGFYLRP